MRMHATKSLYMVIYSMLLDSSPHTSLDHTMGISHQAVLLWSMTADIVCIHLLLATHMTSIVIPTINCIIVDLICVRIKSCTIMLMAAAEVLEEFGLLLVLNSTAAHAPRVRSPLSILQ